MFGVFVVFYLFLGGTGAGAVVTCSLADLVLVRQPFGTSAYVQGPSVRPEARIVDFGFVAGFALLVAGILASDNERRDRMGTVTAQRACTREGGTHSALCDAHTIGQPSFLHACFSLFPILAPGELSNRACAR